MQGVPLIAYGEWLVNLSAQDWSFQKETYKEPRTAYK